MEANFWHNKWEKNEIAFHESAANPLLIKHLPALSLQPESRIFVPLCGKSLDMPWLRAQGFRVVGVELSELAVTQFFEEMGCTPTRQVIGQHQHYQSPGIEIWVGDIFTLKPDQLGEVNAIYDRAALVAMPAELRTRYANQVQRLSGYAPQLVITYEYDQAVLAGPPFSISEADMHTYFDQQYEMQLLVDAPLAGGLKGKCPAQEKVWLMQPKTRK
jgi:thiopurine S-methyltransferase